MTIINAKKKMSNQIEVADATRVLLSLLSSSSTNQKIKQNETAAEPRWALCVV
jgi:hypothetical protein